MLVTLQNYFVFTFYGCLNIKFSYSVEILAGKSNQPCIHFWRGVFWRSPWSKRTTTYLAFDLWGGKRKRDHTSVKHLSVHHQWHLDFDLRLRVFGKGHPPNCNKYGVIGTFAQPEHCTHAPWAARPSSRSSWRSSRIREEPYSSPTVCALKHACLCFRIANSLNSKCLKVVTTVVEA